VAISRFGLFCGIAFTVAIRAMEPESDAETAKS
jgi:hypothetical protein